MVAMETELKVPNVAALPTWQAHLVEDCSEMHPSHNYACFLHYGSVQGLMIYII